MTNNTPLAASPTFAELGELTVALMDREIDRQLGKDAKETVVGFLYRWYYTTRLYTVLMPDNLLSTTEQIFQNEILRDFVLNLTKQVQVNVTDWDDVIPMLTDALLRSLFLNPYTEVEENSCLIPLPIQEQLRLEPTYCKSILEQNTWLVVLLMVYLFFHLSDAFALQADTTELDKAIV
jgi:hypothetical protein